jgi:hypothetical protein
MRQRIRRHLSDHVVMANRLLCGWWATPPRWSKPRPSTPNRSGGLQRQLGAAELDRDNALRELRRLNDEPAAADQETQ